MPKMVTRDMDLFVQLYGNFNSELASENIKIIGGSILAVGSVDVGYGYGETAVKVPPLNNNGEKLYLTTIQLENITQMMSVDEITTSDNIKYETKDLYTSEEGIIYLYLPEGERTVTIQSDGKRYTGSVETKNTGSEVVVLNEN